MKTHRESEWLLNYYMHYHCDSRTSTCHVSLVFCAKKEEHVMGSHDTTPAALPDSPPSLRPITCLLFFMCSVFTILGSFPSIPFWFREFSTFYIPTKEHFILRFYLGQGNQHFNILYWTYWYSSILDVCYFLLNCRFLNISTCITHTHTHLYYWEKTKNKQIIQRRKFIHISNYVIVTLNFILFFNYIYMGAYEL